VSIIASAGKIQPRRADRYGDPAAIHAADVARAKGERRAAALASWESRRAHGSPHRRTVPDKVKPATFHIPGGLDPATLPDDLRWPACYVLNVAWWRAVTWRADRAGFSHLKAHSLRDVIGRDLWRRVRVLLRDRGLLVEDGRVVRGAKCRGYRWAGGYGGNRAVTCPDEGLNRRIAAAGARAQENLQPVHRWLRSKFARLTFDTGRAAREVAALKPPRGTKAAGYRAARQANFDAFADGTHAWWRVNAYGRFHTPLTCLERELRPCVSAGGEALVEVDLVNSQPLLLGLLVRDFLAGDRWARGRLCNRPFHRDHPYVGWTRRRPHLNTPSPPPTPPTPTTTHPTHTRLLRGHSCRNVPSGNGLGKSLSAQGADDVADYLGLCAAGQFYEALMTEKELAGGSRARRRVKVRFYRVLFGRNPRRGRWPNELRRRFADRFPTVAAVLAELKRKDYKHSVRLLQSFESFLFIHTICGRLMRECPDAPVYTIHDSILTTGAYAAVVVRLIREAFAAYGVEVQLSIKGGIPGKSGVLGKRGKKGAVCGK
jgi:hypothetical protein